MFVTTTVLACLLPFLLSALTKEEHTYILQPFRRPVFYTISSSQIYHRITSASRISQRSLSAFDALLACEDKVVWGVCASGDSVAVEAYVYGYDVLRRKWDCFDDALGGEGIRIGACPSLPFAAGMVSFELEAGKVDAYNLHHPFRGYCVSVEEGGRVRLKNRYRFYTPCERAEARRVAQQSGMPLLFESWQFSLCLAEKSDARTGIYFSGVRCADILRSNILPPSIRGMQTVPGACLLDVGYDVRGGKVVKVGVYGCRR